MRCTVSDSTFGRGHPRIRGRGDEPPNVTMKICRLLARSTRPCALIAALLWSAHAIADLGSGTIVLTPVAAGLQLPVDVVAAPGDSTRLFVVEQAGRVRIVRDGVVVATPFLDLTAVTSGGGESGLLGLA